MPIGGGAIAAELLPLVLPSPILADTDLRLPLRDTRSAISTLASVVSLGSPGSAAWAPITAAASAAAGWSELARWRLLGGWLLAAELGLWAAVRLDSGAVVSPSSPDASRDSVWITWSISNALAVLLRLRFPALCDDEFGDDMVAGKIEGGHPD